MLPQWHVKDPCHSTKSAGGRLHLNTHTLLTQQSQSELTMLSRFGVRVYKRNELTHHTSGNTLPQSAQLAGPLWTDPGLKSGIVVHNSCKLFALKKKKMQVGIAIENLPPKLLYVREKTPPLDLDECVCVPYVFVLFVCMCVCVCVCV